MQLVRVVALVAATMTTGLIAGLFYAYACSVMIALRRADDRTFIDVMQRISKAIQNGWFALSFVGAFVFTALAAVLYLIAGEPLILLFVTAAFAAYLVCLVITFSGNIPLNNRLDAAGPADRIADPAAVRQRFEAPWVRLNTARTLASTVAFGCLCMALALRAVEST
jgi:uncharacterized membrane protein